MIDILFSLYTYIYIYIYIYIIYIYISILKPSNDVLGVTHISNLPTVCVKLTQVGGWV